MQWKRSGVSTGDRTSAPLADESRALQHLNIIYLMRPRRRENSRSREAICGSDGRAYTISYINPLQRVSARYCAWSTAGVSTVFLWKRVTLSVLSRWRLAPESDCCLVPAQQLASETRGHTRSRGRSQRNAVETPAVDRAQYHALTLWSGLI